MSLAGLKKQFNKANQVSITFKVGSWFFSRSRRRGGEGVEPYVVYLVLFHSKSSPLKLI